MTCYDEEEKKIGTLKFTLDIYESTGLAASGKLTYEVTEKIKDALLDKYINIANTALDKEYEFYKYYGMNDERWRN